APPRWRRPGCRRAPSAGPGTARTGTGRPASASHRWRPGPGSRPGPLRTATPCGGLAAAGEVAGTQVVRPLRVGQLGAGDDPGPRGGVRAPGLQDDVAAG